MLILGIVQEYMDMLITIRQTRYAIMQVVRFRVQDIMNSWSEYLSAEIGFAVNNLVYGLRKYSENL